MWSVQKNRKFRRSIGSIFKKVKRSRRKWNPDSGYGAWTAEKRVKTYVYNRYETDELYPGNAKDSDLFICEGMYGEKEKAAKAVEYKHMTFYEAAHLAKDAQVKEMWLTHYSPSLTRPEEYMDEVRRIFPEAKAGKDRMSRELAFE